MPCLQCFYSNIGLAKHKKKIVSLLMVFKLLNYQKLILTGMVWKELQVYISKIIKNNYQFLLQFMQILNLLQKRSVVVNLLTKNLRQKNTRSTQLVVFVIKLFVVTIKNIQEMKSSIVENTVLVYL